MDQTAIPRWEWRAFAPSFDWIDPLIPGEFVIAHETYILSAASHANVKIRGYAVEVKILDATRDGLELWQPSLREEFPLCHRAVREVYARLEVAPPHSLFLPQYSRTDFLTDLLCCTDGVRIVGVNKTRHHRLIDGCIFERATLSVAGRTVQSVAVESADPDAARRLIHRLRLDQYDNVNYPAFLRRQLGIAAATAREPVTAA